MTTMTTPNPKTLKNLKANPSLFAQKILHFKPFNYQEKLLNDPAERIIACMGRQTGKTTTIATKAIHYTYAHKNTTTLIISPSLRQSMIMFDKILSLTTQNPLLQKSITRKTRTIIQLTNKSQIIALPCSEHMLRGYTAHQIICDEAAFIPEQIITEIVFPMLSTTKGQAIFLSTPWDKNHIFYKNFTNPKYNTYKIKATDCPLIDQQFLEEMRQNMTEEAYKREYEAEFTEAQNSYFPQNLIRKCVELAQKTNQELYTSIEQEIPKSNYYMGIDFGKLQDHSATAIIKTENNTLQLCYIHEFPLETPYTHVIGHIAKANKKFQFQKILADQTGIGEPILEEIQNQDIKNIEGIKLTTETKEEILATLKIFMEQEKLAIPYDRQLCQQINEEQYAYSKTGHLLFTHSPNVHDDMLWALALAVYATRTHASSKLWIIPKMSKGKGKLQQLRKKLVKHQATGVTR